MILKVAMPGKVQFKLIRREPAFFMAHEGDIHYIGGADVLPAPLETEQENEVIQDLATEEYAQEARSILIEHNLRLVVYRAKNFDRHDWTDQVNQYIQSREIYQARNLCIPMH